MQSHPDEPIESVDGAPAATLEPARRRTRGGDRRPGGRGRRARGRRDRRRGRARSTPDDAAADARDRGRGRGPLAARGDAGRGRRAGPALDRRRAHRRDAPGGGRPARVHRPRRELPAGPRCAHGGRDPDRRHPPRGCRRVRRRGVRPADRSARPRASGRASSAPRTSRSASTPPPPTRRRCSCSSARSTAGSAAARRSRRSTSSTRSAAWRSGRARSTIPATAAATLEAAVRATVEGRPGPALISLPEDVLDLPIPEGTRVPVVRAHPETPNPADVRAVLHFLAAAERPVILAGAGVLRARCSNDLVRFAELLHVPVIAAWRRGDVIPNDHALFQGMAGFGSPSVVRERLASRRRAAGHRQPPQRAHDLRVPDPGDGPALDARGPRAADERRGLRGRARARHPCGCAGLPARRRGPPQGRRARRPSRSPPGTGNNASIARRGRPRPPSTRSRGTGPGVHPGRIIAELRRLLPDDAIITTDAGAFGGWAARGFRFRRPGTFLGPTSGAMGYGFPAALAAALVHRERRVVALVGDGGMGMTLAEVETAVREGAHVVAIVFDNERYGMIRDHQVRAGSAANARDRPRARGLRRRRPGLRCAWRAGRHRRRVRGRPADGPRGVRPDGHPAGAGPRAGSRSTSRRRPEPADDPRDAAPRPRGGLGRSRSGRRRTRPPRSTPTASSTAPTATTRCSRRPTGSTAPTRSRSSS